MMTIKIGDREIPLYMSSLEMIAIQDEVGCTVGQIWDSVFGMKKDPETDETSFEIIKDPEKIKKFGKLIRVLGNAGLEEDGKEPDLDDKWILRRIKPGMIMAYLFVIAAVINEAMSMETNKAKDGPVDVILEEENRKKEPGSSPTGGSAPADSLPD